MRQQIFADPNTKSKAIDRLSNNFNRVYSRLGRSFQSQCSKTKTRKEQQRKHLVLSKKQNNENQDVGFQSERNTFGKTKQKDIQRVQRDFRSLTNRTNGYKVMESKNLNESQKEEVLPYLKQSRYANSANILKSMGYDKEMRSRSQIYEDTINQKKAKYTNKIQTLRKQLILSSGSKQSDFRMQMKIQCRIVREQIKRKTEKQMILKNQKQQRRKFLQLLSRNQPNPQNYQSDI